VSTKKLCAHLFVESAENLVVQVPRALIASGCWPAVLDFSVLVLLVERGRVERASRRP